MENKYNGSENMLKEEFEKLSIDKQIVYINSQLGLKSFRKLSEELNIPRSTLQRRIKKGGYKLDSKQNKYIVDNQYKTIENILENQYDSTEKSISNQYSNNILKNQYKTTEKSIENQYTNQELKELLDMKKKLKQIIKWFDNEKGAIKDNKLTIEFEKFEGNAVSRTFVVYENILNDYKKFCNNNKKFKKQDILSQALYEFLERYR
jgi:hypothetical protein